MEIEAYYKIEISPRDSFYKEALDSFLALKLSHFVILNPESFRVCFEDEKIAHDKFEIRIYYDKIDVKKSLQRLASKRVIYFSKETGLWRINEAYYSRVFLMNSRVFFENIYTNCSNEVISYSGPRATYTYKINGEEENGES